MGCVGKSAPGRENYLGLQKTSTQHTQTDPGTYTNIPTPHIAWQYSDTNPQAGPQSGATFTWIDRRAPQNICSFSGNMFIPSFHWWERGRTNIDASLARWRGWEWRGGGGVL